MAVLCYNINIPSSSSKSINIYVHHKRSSIRDFLFQTFLERGKGMYNLFKTNYLENKPNMEMVVVQVNFYTYSCCLILVIWFSQSRIWEFQHASVRFWWPDRIVCQNYSHKIIGDKLIVWRYELLAYQSSCNEMILDSFLKNHLVLFRQKYFHFNTFMVRRIRHG